MDNLGSHKGKAVRRLMRLAGAKLIFLPKYSPDLNPIEQVFAKLKHLLRKCAARTIEAICAAIGQLLQAFTPQECANYFTNAGYAPTCYHLALAQPLHLSLVQASSRVEDGGVRRALVSLVRHMAQHRPQKVVPVQRH